MSTSYTLRDVFQHGLKKYLARHELHLPYFQVKAAVALRDCRTAALGGHAKWCPNGHVEGRWYNSCRHRACPQCCWTKIDEWLEKVRHRILPTEHRHITCTLPAELRILWRFNKRLIGDLLLKTVREVLFSLLEDPKFLGAKPGLILNLHTWRRDLLLHVHVHCLITHGGWTPDGCWKKPRWKTLVPTQLIAKKLNERLTKALKRLLKSGQLRLPEDMTRFDAEKLISKAQRKRWVVNRKHRYRHGEGVAAYLARYLRGGPIKNSRLLRLDEQTDEVTIRISRRNEPVKTRKISVEDFIDRVLLHVPRPGYRVVRSCGLYHHHYAEQLEACRQQLGGGHVPADDEATPSATTTEDPDDESWVMREDYCRICGCLLETQTIPRGPPPPELARYWGRSA